MSSPKSILMVLTSHDKLGSTDTQTGWYLPELAHPYSEFMKAGLKVTLASIKGGAAPCDEGSIEASQEDQVCMTFWNTPETKALTESTIALNDVVSSDYDAVFYVGGFGTMWDFPDNSDVQRVAKEIYEANGVVSAVCHGPVALVNVKLSDGSYLVEGKEVAGFTNEEEDAVARRSIVPYTCEDKLGERGAKYTKGGVFQSHVAISGRLITGQNPPSAGATAAAIIQALK